MQRKSGISLIVLVITIIVMVTLAGIIILSLNNSGIFNQASTAVGMTNFNQVKQLADLKWAEAYNNGVREQEGLEEAVLSGLQQEGINIYNYDIFVTTIGVDIAAIDFEELKLNPRGVIPEGATYTVNETGEVLNAGDKFPKTTATGDSYVYGDYIYRYNQDTFGAKVESQNGWGVRLSYKHNSNECGEILESINRQYITSLDRAFEENNIITVAPAIPDTVTNMERTFSNCKSLTDVSKVKIPEDVTNIKGIFKGCTSIVNASNIIIHEGISSMQYAFAGCTSLTSEGLPTLVDGLLDMSYVFQNCTSLTVTPEIPNTVTNLEQTFISCTSLKEVVNLPSNLVNMSNTFHACTNLESVPSIPENVTDMLRTFKRLFKAKKRICHFCESNKYVRSILLC